MRNCIEYVLRQDKTNELFTCVTGPYCHDEINYDLVYRTFLEEKKLWDKDSGRIVCRETRSKHGSGEILLLGGVVHVQLLDRADGVLGEADLHTVSTGLQNKGIVLDCNNTANDTANGGDLIADLQAAAHCGILLLLLLLGTIDHEVQQNQHQSQCEEQADVAFGSGSQKLHGAKSPLKIQISLLYLFKRPVARLILKFGYPEALHIYRGKP